MVNKMILQGRMVAAPELRQTQNGTPVCSFRVAWSETVKERETKLFLPCVAWQGTAELVSKYFPKGKEIAVEGKLSTREYEDRDGNRRSSTEMTVERVHFCGSKQDGGQSGSQSYGTGKAQFAEVDEAFDDGDDFLPF